MRKFKLHKAELIFIGSAFAVFIAVLLFRIPCLFYSITSLQCPGCGTTRMIYALLNLDFKSAFHYNPAIMLLSPVFVYMIIVNAISYIKTGQFTNTKIYNIIVASSIVVLVIFTIYRNVDQIQYLLSSFSNEIQTNSHYLING